MAVTRDTISTSGELAIVHPADLEALLRGRTFGLMAVDGLRGPDLLRQARSLASAYLRKAGLGLIMLAACRRADSDTDATENGGEVEVTFLLIGPMGDDHGRVKGALRTLGAQCVQARAMIKLHGAGHMTTIWLGAGVVSPSEAVQADPFDVTKLGTYCASLRDKHFDLAMALEVCPGSSFFSRRPTDWRVAGSGRATGDQR